MKNKDRYSTQSVKRQSLLLIQRQLLNKTLASSEGGPTWKILIFDSYNRGIVSSQLKMKDLRDQNITLYLNLSQERQQIHGVTILYLVQPTLENAEIIARDLLDDMYTNVYIHFSSQPSPNILSTLAKKLTSVKKNSAISKITKIQYSCIGYYPIDHSMCILPTEVQIVNLLTAMSYQPIFIYNSSNQAVKKLVDNIKIKLTSVMNSISGQNNSTSNTTNFAIFYIFNRETDYFPMLAHGITYASLLQDLYKISKTGNKVNKSSNNKQANNTQLSLQDQIWLQKKNYLISQMHLQKQSNKIQSKMMGLSTEQYTQYNQKFKKIQWHLNNAGEMIAQAKKRRLNEFYEVQLEIYNKSIISKETKRDMLTLLKQGQDSEDKVRLLLIYMQFVDNIDEEIQQFQQAFPDITKNKKYNEIKEKRLRGSVAESASNKYIKKFAKGIWKNIMASDKKFRITKQLEKVKTTDFNELIEGGLAVQSINGLPNNIKIQRNIVYCLGGVCFHQYGNLMEFDPDALYTGDQVINFRDVI